MGRPAIFLDRDGVINENLSDHVRSWAAFRFLPGALAAIRAITELQVPIIVVTNQAVIGRRLMSEDCLDDIHNRMRARIRHAGGKIAEVFYCPHSPEMRCWCRKPAPGMLIAAATRFDLDLSRSIFVGDAVSDLQAGELAGCRTILVETGRGRDALRELVERTIARPTAVAADLLAAVPLIASWLYDDLEVREERILPVTSLPTIFHLQQPAASGVAD